MLTKEDLEWTKYNELEILKSRKCDPGDFYFQKRTLSSIDPFTNEKTWSTSNEYCEPVIERLKGSEHEVIPSGLLEQGDIIATIDWREEISTSEPTEVGETQYLKAVYKGETYRIKYNHKDGLGSNTHRQILLLSKEK